MIFNGAWHLANDTFLAVSAEDTENAYLVSGSVISQRVTPLPLARRVQFNSLSSRGEDIESSAGLSSDGALPVHCLRASSGGRFTAAVNIGRRRHFVIHVLSARVCEFMTPSPVVAAVWHPLETAPVLLLLCSTGEVMAVRADKVRLGVAFCEPQKINVRKITDDLRDAANGCSEEAVAKHKDPRGRRRPTAPSNTLRIAQREYEQGAAQIEKGGEKTPETEEKSNEKTQTEAEDDDKEKESIAQTEEGENIVEKDCADSNVLIALATVSPTRGLPSLLLMLSRGGDIFSLRIGDDGLPAPRGPGGDGRVPALQENVNFIPAHFVAGGDGKDDVALALGAVCLDEDVGLFALFTLYESGALRGWYCNEPELLAHRPVHRAFDFSITLTPILSRGGAQLQSCGNVTLVQCGAGSSAYICVWPQWSNRIGAWVLRQKPEEGSGAVPIVGRTAKVPAPLALRLPYSGGGVAVGRNDILVLPECIEAGGGRFIIAKITNLILAAHYAQGDRFELVCGKKREESAGELEVLLNTTAEGCRRWLCAHPHEDIDETTAQLAQYVQFAHASRLKRQAELTQREQKLAVRVDALSERLGELVERIDKAKVTVRDALVHRRGPSALYAANEQLGEIHDLLHLLETNASRRAGDLAKN